MFAIARLFAVGALAAVALTGCATAVPGSGPHSAASATFRTIDNCGTSVDFRGAAPQRVVTIKSTSTEMLLALGLGKRIVGTAFQDGPVPAKWRADAAKLTSLSTQVPAQEVVLSKEPDLVYAGWESNFSADGAGTRGDLAALGIKTYVSPAACKEPGYQPKKLRFHQVFQEIGEVASIFHVSGTKLLTAEKKQLAGIHKDTRGLSALWYSSGADTPYVGAGIGAPQLVLDTIGLKNIAAGVTDTWTPLNWESIVDDNPDVIVLVDAAWNPAAKKIALLQSNPATANLDAVKQHRYLFVDFAESEAGVRSVSAAAHLAAQLAKISLSAG